MKMRKWCCLLVLLAVSGVVTSDDNATDAPYVPKNDHWLVGGTAELPKPGTSLWGSSIYFADVSPSDVPGSLNATTLEAEYGPAALERAKTWVRQGKSLWCGTAADPDSEPFEGVFPSTIPPTTTTNWPGACPNSARAQQLFDWGLVWRYMFNDNEAACAFRAAQRNDPTCAMAFVGAALSMGPNVNYAVIVSPGVFHDILESLDGGRSALASGAQQMPLAAALYGAMLQRYCVDTPGKLDRWLALPQDEAFKLYQNESYVCEEVFRNSTLQLVNKYPEDPNLSAIAAGALMEQPAWLWWQVGSIIASALTDVTFATNSTANKTALGQLSSLILPYNAIANTILQRGTNTEQDNLGLLHYLIHDLEANPQPALALNAARRLFDLGGDSQGHAAHMRTHIDMRVGDYASAIDGNKLAVIDDADWNLARSGGGIMSVLYKYVPHNVAFMTEAAQHAGNWVTMASSISLLNFAAGFQLVADNSQLSVIGHLMRQMLQPLRFGLYTNVISGTEDDTLPILGTGRQAKIQIFLPGSDTKPHSVDCGYSCSTPRLFARTYAMARLRRTNRASSELTLLVQGMCASDPNANNATQGTACGGNHAAKDPVAAAYALGLYYMEQQAKAVAEGAKPLDINNPNAGGTLTIDNSNGVLGLYALVPAAEVAWSRGTLAGKRLAIGILRDAVELQNNMYYDEPSPFFYPVGETLAGRLLSMGKPADILDANNVLRTVLFQWPKSSLATLALAESFRMGPNPEDALSTITQLIAAATKHNDTELKLEWL